MKLYNGTTSPFGRKVKVVALELGIDLTEETIQVTSAAFLDALNPLRQIPTLMLGDGTAIYDSDVICGYLNSLGSETDLIPAAGRWAVETRTALANGLMEAVLQRTMELNRPEAERSPAFIQKLEQRVGRAIPHLEGLASEIAAGPIRLDQIAVACALEYCDFRYPHDWRDRCPALAGWLEALSQRPSMVASRPSPG